MIETVGERLLELGVAALRWMVVNPESFLSLLGGWVGLHLWGRRLQNQGRIAYRGLTAFAAIVFLVKHRRTAGRVAGVLVGVVVLATAIVVWTLVPSIRADVLRPAAAAAIVVAGFGLMRFTGGRFPTVTVLLEALEWRDQQHALRVGGEAVIRGAQGENLGAIEARRAWPTPLGVAVEYRAPIGATPDQVAAAVENGTFAASVNGARHDLKLSNRVLRGGSVVSPSEIEGEGVIALNEIDPFTHPELVEVCDEPTPPGSVRLGQWFDVSDPSAPKLRPLHALVLEANLLIAGIKGSGKSNLMALIIKQLCDRTLFPYCAPVLCDPKLVEFGPWADRATCLGLGAGSTTDILELAYDEMMARYERLATADGYVRKVVPSEETPVMPVVFDELREALKQSGVSSTEQAMRTSKLMALVQMGRAVMIPVIGATQRPSSQAIPADIRDLFDIRICFASQSQDMTEMIIGPTWAQGPAHLIPSSAKGKGFAVTERSRTPVSFQADYLSDDDLVAAAEAVAGDRVDLPGWPKRILAMHGREKRIELASGVTVKKLSEIPGREAVGTIDAKSPMDEILGRLRTEGEG